jgi:hypothetical protein
VVLDMLLLIATDGAGSASVDGGDGPVELGCGGGDYLDVGRVRFALRGEQPADVLDDDEAGSERVDRAHHFVEES